MLNYLDNTTNNKNNPNENYAREFLELFTIVKGPQIGKVLYRSGHSKNSTSFSGIKMKPLQH